MFDLYVDSLLKTPLALHAHRSGGALLSRFFGYFGTTLISKIDDSLHCHHALHVLLMVAEVALGLKAT